MAERARLLYLGLPLGALMLLEDGHDLVTACISRTSSPGMRRLRRRMAREGRLLLARPDLDAAGIRELLESTKPDLVVSWFWTRRIPAHVIELGRVAFGVHPSLLPRHRGADPYFWTLAHRDEETGVTAHLLTPRYDDGAILAQVGLTVPPGSNSWQLARALDRPSLALLREIAGQYARGDEVDAQPQDEEEATMAPAPTDDDCELRWDESVEDVLARVRAGAPEPGAFTGYGDDTIVITRAQAAREAPAALEPGDVAVTSEGVVVRTADGAIVLLEARREGEDRTARGADIVGLFPGIVTI